MESKKKNNAHPDQRPTSSNHVQNCNEIDEPHRHTKARNELASLIRSDPAAPVTALVRNVMYGVPKHYPVASRAGINQATETATVEIKRHKDGIHIFLSKFDTTTSRATGLASFKLIEGGDFNLEAMVCRVTRSFEIVKFSQVANKHDIFWTLQLAVSDVQMNKSKHFWATLCHHLGNSSIQQLSHVNLARPQRLVSTNTQSMISRSKRADDNDDKQRVLTIDVPFEENPWVFTKHLADPEFLRLLDAVESGESTAVDPDEGTEDGEVESSKTTKSKKPKPSSKKAKNLRRHTRRVAAGLTTP